MFQRKLGLPLGAKQVSKQYMGLRTIRVVCHNQQQLLLSFPKSAGASQGDGIVVARRTVAGSQSECDFELAFCLIEIARVYQEITKIGMRVGVVWIEAEGGTE